MYKEVVEKIKSLFPGQDFIPLHEPRFIGNDKTYVADAIDSTFVSSVGKYVDRFEQMIKEYTGAKYAVATVNGTAALHMSLILAGVKRDELVITQALSFIATCNAISYIGAQPLFVDIDMQTMGLSMFHLKDFLEKETRLTDGNCYHKKSGKRIAACIPMHTFGHPVAIDELIEICNGFNVPLIEDAAESIGSKYKGQHTGTFGLLGAFSFNGNKTITCGGGGVITTNNEKLAKQAKHLTTQAKVPHRWDFAHDQIGYNYRLPNLNAALACAQMEKLEDFVINKRELAHIYKDFFKSAGYQFLSEPENARSNYWLNAIILETKEERDKFLNYTNDNYVMTRPVWQLMTKLPMFKDCISYGIENSQIIEDRLVNIPSSVRLR